MGPVLAHVIDELNSKSETHIYSSTIFPVIKEGSDRNNITDQDQIGQYSDILMSQAVVSIK